MKKNDAKWITLLVLAAMVVLSFVTTASAAVPALQDLIGLFPDIDGWDAVCPADGSRIESNGQTLLTVDSEYEKGDLYLIVTAYYSSTEAVPPLAPMFAPGMTSIDMGDGSSARIGELGGYKAIFVLDKSGDVPEVDIFVVLTSKSWMVFSGQGISEKELCEIINVFDLEKFEKLNG